MIAIGSFRVTICAWRWAIKIARGAMGRRCNRYEADVWSRATASRRRILCPVVVLLPQGIALIMTRAKPLSEEEAHQLRMTHGFPDWDYDPFDPDDQGSPLEPKGSDWGHLPDGRLVALDYSTHAFSEPDEEEP